MYPLNDQWIEFVAKIGKKKNVNEKIILNRIHDQ